jgi:SAM-dependent methyltransferase
MNYIHKNIKKYYSSKIKLYGATPKGVDWNGEESQLIRFEQLSKIIQKEKFTITDLGCGYGKYTEYLTRYFSTFSYRGYDLSLDMIQNAKRLYHHNNISFIYLQSMKEIESSDYIVASGIFSVKMKHSEAQWLSYILETLDILYHQSKEGFSFNMLTKYSDKEYIREDLYYADPLFIFDYCKRNFSRNVTLIHDYDLYEFSILVRKK